MSRPESAADRGLQVLRLDHFNIPIRDINVARKFYTEVLGGVLLHDGVWYWVPDSSRAGGTYIGHIDIKLFDAEGILQAHYQPFGWASPDQIYPCRCFRVRSAERFDLLLDRLSEAEVPFVLTAEREASAGEPVRAAAYLRDPDGNQLQLTCHDYPFREGIHVGPFDPARQYYPWADWGGKVPYGGPPERELEAARGGHGPGLEGQARTAEYGSGRFDVDLAGVDRFVFPVRSADRAAFFYSQVLGAEILDPDSREIGARKVPTARVRLCSGVELSLAEQRGGWLPVDTPNPHWGFAVRGADFDAWMAHIESWGIPFATVVRTREVVENGVPTRVELHIFDPDGTHLELVAWDYPLTDKVERFQFSPWKLLYRYTDWPPAGGAVASGAASA